MVRGFNDNSSAASAAVVIKKNLSREDSDKGINLKYFVSVFLNSVFLSLEIIKQLEVVNRVSARILFSEQSV